MLRLNLAAIWRKYVSTEQCRPRDEGCEAVPAVAALNGSVWLKPKAFIETTDPVRWVHCVQLDMPSICLTFSDKDVERINHGMLSHLHDNVAIFAKNRVIASTSVVGPIRNVVVLGAIDEADRWD